MGNKSNPKHRISLLSIDPNDKSKGHKLLVNIPIFSRINADRGDTYQIFYQNPINRMVFTNKRLLEHLKFIINTLKELPTISTQKKRNLKKIVNQCNKKIKQLNDLKLMRSELLNLPKDLLDRRLNLDLKTKFVCELSDNHTSYRSKLNNKRFSGNSFFVQAHPDRYQYDFPRRLMEELKNFSVIHDSNDTSFLEIPTSYIRDKGRHWNLCVQFFFGCLNQYILANKSTISFKSPLNLGARLNNSAALVDKLISKINSRENITATVFIEKLFEFVNENHSDLGLIKGLTTEQQTKVKKAYIDCANSFIEHKNTSGGLSDIFEKFNQIIIKFPDDSQLSYEKEDSSEIAMELGELVSTKRHDKKKHNESKEGINKNTIKINDIYNNEAFFKFFNIDSQSLTENDHLILKCSDLYMKLKKGNLEAAYLIYNDLNDKEREYFANHYLNVKRRNHDIGLRGLSDMLKSKHSKDEFKVLELLLQDLNASNIKSIIKYGRRKKAIQPLVQKEVKPESDLTNKLAMYNYLSSLDQYKTAINKLDKIYQKYDLIRGRIRSSYVFYGICILILMALLIASSFIIPPGPIALLFMLVEISSLGLIAAFLYKLPDMIASVYRSIRDYFVLKEIDVIKNQNEPIDGKNQDSSIPSSAFDQERTVTANARMNQKSNKKQDQRMFTETSLEESMLEESNPVEAPGNDQNTSKDLSASG